MDTLRNLIALSLVFAAIFYAGIHFSIETADEVAEPAEAGMEAEMAKMEAAMDEAAKRHHHPMKALAYRAVTSPGVLHKDTMTGEQQENILITF